MAGFFNNPAPPPVMSPVATPEDPTEAASRLARERRRRAQGETIATSYRGLPDEALQSPQTGRKKLIGE